MLRAKIFIGVLSIGALFLWVFLGATDVFATVGGPTYIERLSYSSTENSLYYLIDEQGGRGCPNEIGKLDLASKERSLVMSCDEIESAYRTENGFDSAGYDQFIQDKFRALTGLPPINLSKNNISVVVAYVGEHKYDEYNISSDFRATVLQNGEEKGAIDFVGCYKDQPNVFRGYLIPNTDKLALMISRIGNCFEGGYTEENLYVVDKIAFSDKTELWGSSSGPEIHLGDLVVSTQTIKEPVDTITEEPKKNDLFFVWGALALVLGLAVGYLIGQRAKNRSSQ